MMRLVQFFVLIIFYSCNLNTSPILINGSYRGVLQVSEYEELPFQFQVTSTHSLTIFNAEEQILVDEIEYKKDSVYIKMPVYESYIVATTNKDEFSGYFVKESLNRIVPFKAKRETHRFTITQKPTTDVTGNWETTFSANTKEDRYKAKGIFKQIGNRVTGTFLTTTGDYRFLDGILNENQLKLSTFDGAHAFLFTATVTDSTMQGTFFSGNHFKEPFVAKRNETYKLPNANALTFLKEGYDSIQFSFPDEQGNIISLNDKRFKNKVVIVQIMGSWCPNCLDESKYYSQFYKENKPKDIEFIGLAFEYAKTEEKAFNNINRLKRRIGIDYPLLLAQFGTSSKTKAQEKLPMLNHVLSYPTTIFIDKYKKVRKIHTGFSGPATGEKYIAFQKEFEDFVNRLLIE